MTKCEVGGDCNGEMFFCGLEMQPMLSFCRKHYVEHVVAAHGYPLSAALKFVRAVKKYRKSQEPGIAETKRG